MKNELPYPETTKSTYRPDIDGLRAVAVLLVVGYHAFPNWVTGGFVGVDIFFVISGFLISRIIFEGLKHESFSLVDFYSRRIRRIFPALFVVLAISFSFGWFTLLSDEYKQLGKHIVGGAGFISNFILWKENGYFDNAADTKPLLHLWSLGIEEQFYIIWPLLLWAVWKKRLNWLAITVIIAAISFALSLHSLHQDAVAAFYLPQMRFWELLIGCTLAYLTLYEKNVLEKIRRGLDGRLGAIIYAQAPEADGSVLCDALALLGTTLIGAGALLITKAKPFPGTWALLPTIGAALIISAGSRSWINRTVLSSRLLVWFGLISFPLYLWHWPILSFARIIDGEMPSRVSRIVAILTSIALAWFTFRLIEKPVRFGNYGRAKTTVLLALMLVVGYAGYNSYKRDGLPFRAHQKKFQKYTESIALSDKTRECEDIPFAYKKASAWFCGIGKEANPPQIFVYGDSHAFSLLPALEKLSAEKNTTILLDSVSGCLPLLGVVVDRGPKLLEEYNCPKLNDRIFEYVRSHKIKSVLLASRWTYYDKGNVGPAKGVSISSIPGDAVRADWPGGVWYEYGIKNTIKKYKRIGVHLYILMDNPTQLYAPKDALKKSILTDASINKFSIKTESHKEFQSWITNRFKSIGGEMTTVVDTDKLLCGNDICPLAADGRFLYFDKDHLSITGAMLVYPSLENAIGVVSGPASGIIDRQ